METEGATMASNKPMKTSWSLEFPFRFELKTKGDGTTDEDSAIVFVFFLVASAVLLFCSFGVSNNIIKFGVLVPWVRRECMVFGLYSALWFITFFQPTIAKKHD